jgi:hypothetical protein
LWLPGAAKGRELGSLGFKDLGLAGSKRFDWEVAKMKFSWIRILPVMAISAACTAFPALLRAQSMCDTNNLHEEAELQRALPPSCQKERLQASGGVSMGVLISAESKANNQWRHEAVTKYGERYAEVQFMACRKVFCVQGSIKGSKRCTISGFPCAADMVDQDKSVIQRIQSAAALERPPYQGEGAEEMRSAYGGYNRPLEETDLNEEQIRHLQEMLGVTPDGDFGPTSYRALRDFRRNAGLPLEGAPSHADLEKLAHSERREWGR